MRWDLIPESKGGLRSLKEGEQVQGRALLAAQKMSFFGSFSSTKMSFLGLFAAQEQLGRAIPTPAGLGMLQVLSGRGKAEFPLNF